ncbi:hypothetical protein LZ31DRAFT_485895, partial [Colletotrichum somersetense]
LKHFNQYIKSYIKGTYYLLILETYNSYKLTKFNNYCKEEVIITLYIPSYLLYKL